MHQHCVFVSHLPLLKLFACLKVQTLVRLVSAESCTSADHLVVSPLVMLKDDPRSFEKLADPSAIAVLKEDRVMIRLASVVDR